VGHYTRQAESSAVLALAVDGDESLARRTLSLLPASIPKLMARIHGKGGVTTLAGLVYSLVLIGKFGQARGTDPGRPGVPDFGRRIYHLRHKTSSPQTGSMIVERAVRRKQKALSLSLSTVRDTQTLRDGLRCQIRALEAASFGAVVFDYDGTLVSRAERFDGPRPEIAAHLNQLLATGIRIGVATGRGDSVRTDLRRALSAEHWNSVMLGYHNGSEIAPLSSDEFPSEDKTPTPLSSQAKEACLAHPHFRKLCECHDGRFHLSFRAKPSVPINVLWHFIQEILLQQNVSGVRAVWSAHSVDVLDPQVSKTQLISALQALLVPNAACILAIGDQGRWPGNDFELLHSLHSISVDEVSGDIATCWNLAPPGCRGVEATLYYLKNMLLESGRFRLAFPEVRSL